MRDSNAEFQVLDFARPKRPLPAQKSNFSAQAGSHSKRRATDHTAEHWDVVGLVGNWLIGLTVGWIVVGLAAFGVLRLASWISKQIVAAFS
jgi:hypothetical protein